MEQKINSFIIPEQVIKNMKEKIKDSKRLKIETGFPLCKDIDKLSKDDLISKSNINIIKKGEDCKGKKCEIKMNECGENQLTIGSYHTHPNSIPTLSIVDMSTGCQEDLTCVGSVPWNSIRCFTRKTDKSKCYDDVFPYIEKEKEFIQTNNYIIETLKSPKKILNIGIPKFIKDFREYDKKTGEYLTLKTKLLKDNFDQVEIK